MTILFDKKLDNLPTANDIILDEIVKEITHHIEQNRATKKEWIRKQNKQPSEVLERMLIKEYGRKINKETGSKQKNIN